MEEQSGIVEDGTNVPRGAIVPISSSGLIKSPDLRLTKEVLIYRVDRQVVSNGLMTFTQLTISRQYVLGDRTGCRDFKRGNG